MNTNIAKRMSLTLPADLENEVVELRRSEKFCRCSYSEILRFLIKAGIKSYEEGQRSETVSR